MLFTQAFSRRLLSALILGTLALVALALGGMAFGIFCAVAASLVFSEWTRISGVFENTWLRYGIASLVGLYVLAAFFWPISALIGLSLAFIVLLFKGAREKRFFWLALGLLYADLPGIAALLLRGPFDFGKFSLGFMAVAFIFLITWATDSAAYMVGRSLKGPKLAPRISPGKTWSGAFGGLIAGSLAGALFALFIESDPIALLALGALLSCAAQMGDLAESAFKRHFLVKDSGRLIPGHGGMMDRVDGLIIALALGAMIGFLRSEEGAIAEGLLLW